MGCLQRIHWVAPTLMAGSLCVGILLAIGHHLFYHSLSEHTAPTSQFSFAGSRMPKQQLNTTIGTAFAFLFKASLVLAVSISYVQVFWRSTKSKNTKKLATLAILDKEYGALGNVLTLFDLRVWAKAPLLLLLATTAWLIPLASIITPATLSVSTAPYNPSPVFPAIVPSLNFSTLNFVGNMPALLIAASDPSVYHLYGYNRPSQATQNIVDAVVAQGVILPISAPAHNASWTLEFRGPLLRCNNVSDSQTLAMQRNIATWLSEGKNCESNLGYLSWFPRLSGDAANLTSDALPFFASRKNESLSFDSGSFSGLELGVLTNLTFYIATLPSLLLDTTTLDACSLSTNKATTSTDPLGPYGLDSTFLQCELFETSYDVGFSYIDGVQNIITNISNTKQESLVDPLMSVIGPANGSFVGCGCHCDPTLDPGDACVFNTTNLERLSYQSIFDAFTSQLLGSVYYSGGYLQQNTSILESALLDTYELSFLTDERLQSRLPGYDTSNFTLQQAISDDNSTYARGLVTTIEDIPRQSLKDALEEMFRNATVSLMSSAALQPNEFQTTANVTSEIWRPIYVYSAQKLWLAYGLALLFSSAAVLIGFQSMLSNGASFSNNFSAVLRTARHANLSVEPHRLDAHGADPLPSYLARSRVEFASGVRPSQQESADMEMYCRIKGSEMREPKTPSMASSLLASGGNGVSEP